VASDPVGSASPASRTPWGRVGAPCGAGATIPPRSARRSGPTPGGVAQFGRALRSQRRGRRFKSDHLHHENRPLPGGSRRSGRPLFVPLRTEYAIDGAQHVPQACRPPYERGSRRPPGVGDFLPTAGIRLDRGGPRGDGTAVASGGHRRAVRRRRQHRPPLGTSGAAARQPPRPRRRQVLARRRDPRCDGAYDFGLGVVLRAPTSTAGTRRVGQLLGRAPHEPRPTGSPQGGGSKSTGIPRVGGFRHPHSRGPCARRSTLTRRSRGYGAHQLPKRR
jgi:hypothetical protein